MSRTPSWSRSLYSGPTMKSSLEMYQDEIDHDNDIDPKDVGGVPSTTSGTGPLHSMESIRKSQHNTQDVNLGRNNEDVLFRPFFLGVGLFLVLFPFWLLDSLKDPLLSTLTRNLERNQPPAKLVSVVTTLFLVCLMDYLSNKRLKPRRKEKRLQSSSILWQATRSDKDVLDIGGVWDPMELDTTSSEPEQDKGVPPTIFAFIGIPYCIAFGIIAYLLQFHVPSSRSPTFDFWHVLGYIVFAVIESYGSLAVAAFWSFANSTLSLEQAERYYGPVIAIAQLGAIGGSTLVSINVYDHGQLVVVACLVIILHIVVMHLYVLKFPPNQTSTTQPPMREVPKHLTKLTWRGREKPAELEWMTGVYMIIKHKYVLLILGASTLNEISLTCLHYQMALMGWERNGAGDPYSDGMAFAQFMGRYGQIVNVSSLVLSSVVFPFFMRRLGLRYTLRIFPSLLLIVNLLVFLALPGKLWVLFLSLALLKAVTYSIHDPSTEILYLPTAPTIKFQAKFWIDVVGARIAKGIGSSINTLAGNVNRSIRVAGAPSLLTAAALWFVCFQAGVMFDGLKENNEIVGSAKRSTDDQNNDCERVSLLNDTDESENEIVFERSSSSGRTNSSSTH